MVFFGESTVAKSAKLMFFDLQKDIPHLGTVPSYASLENLGSKTVVDRN